MKVGKFRVLEFSRTDSVSCKWKQMRVGITATSTFDIRLWTREYDAMLELSLARLYRVMNESLLLYFWCGLTSCVSLSLYLLN